MNGEVQRGPWTAVFTVILLDAILSTYPNPDLKTVLPKPMGEGQLEDKPFKNSNIWPF